MFGRLLVFISQFFAPTTLRITVDKDDLDELDLKKIVQRDERGIVVGIDLPDRMVLMSNHQVSVLSRSSIKTAAHNITP